MREREREKKMGKKSNKDGLAKWSKVPFPEKRKKKQRKR